jgi:hypothetical protein
MITSMIVLCLVIAASVAILVVTAAAQMFYLHMAVAAVIALFMALAALRANTKATEAGDSEASVAALNARYMGIVWSWGSLALFITYISVLSWKEWWQFLIAFVLAAAISMFFAILLRREVEQDTEDPALLNLARILAIVQLAGMLAIMVGLLIDGKMQRFVGAKVHSDWAANNVFFFGAMALALISWMAIKANRRFQNDTNKM